MGRLRLRPGRLVLAGLVLVGLALGLSRWITDALWFTAVGYPRLFWVPLAWHAGTWLAVGALSAAVLWANLQVARPALARAYLRWETMPRVQWTWDQLRRGLWGGALVLALLWAGSVAARWPRLALWVHRQPFGVADPLFGRDVSFFVLDLPAAALLLEVAGTLLLLSFGLSALIYASAGVLSWPNFAARSLVQGRARAHLLALAGLLVLVLSASLWLARYEVMYSPSGIVYGAIFVDAHVRLPGRSVAAVLTAAAGLLVLASAFGRPLRPALAAGALAAAAAVGTELVVPVVQRLWVRPNELGRERVFIQHHIDMTRRAFALDQVRERPMEVVEPGPDFLERASQLLAEVRLWDWRPLGAALSQLQLLRPYYRFSDVDVDRYWVDGRLRQVMVAARELDPSRLQNPSWVNLRLQYTHGFGIVMVPASEVTPTGLPRLVVRDVPPRSEPGWPQIRRPQIYYGQLPADWVVVRTRLGEFDHPSEQTNVFTRYEGRGGVPVGSWWRRLLFAARFRSLELLVSGELSAESRVMMYRSVEERLRRLLPYVRWDRDPYLMVGDDGRLVWIADGYTATDRFPYSRPVAGWGNYVRNPIKATVDAYDGAVTFYLLDPVEPLARAIDGLLGGVLQPADAMPEDVRRHLRYPEELFTVQARALTQYHVRDPAVFYNQEDRWALPMEIYGEAEAPMQPYYAMVDLGEQPEFGLLLPFTAAGRQNMTAWMVARMDSGRYGQLWLYRFPKEVLTYGPMQMEARINQDPDISRELTLWGQRGSRVVRGNLIVVPVGQSLLYVEPLFLVSEQSQLPELRRVIAATGVGLAMAPNLAEAVAAALQRSVGTPPPAAAARRPAEIPGPQAPQAPTEPPQHVAGVRQALEHLEQARRRLQEGDWEGFGRLMDQVESVLRELAGPGS